MSFRKLRITYTQVAVEEITDILLYTEMEWGTQQRKVYRELILDTVRRLSGMPLLGRSRPEVSEGLRSYPLGRHLVYYWHGDDRLIVAHVLHNRRDVTSVDWESPSGETGELPNGSSE